jgi:steroid delta-isomerase-like uncharacterized protein
MKLTKATVMNTPKAVQDYFDAWNYHDAEAIIATFAEGGTYSDPSAGQGLEGNAIAVYAEGLWSTFPDLSFEIISVGHMSANMVAAQWLMRGTNTGPLQGLPPTGRTVEVQGADFLAVEGDRLRSVHGYFDSRAVPDQLGLQVLVQPHAIGSFSFGTSVSVQSGKTCKPGAYSITKLEARSEDEIQQIRQLTRQIATEMLQMPGFISLVAMTVGRRLMTVTAWEAPEHPRQLRGGTHELAMRQFFGSGLAAGGWTGVWIAGHINATWVRCMACARMLDVDRVKDKCLCGEVLPEPVPYW